MPQTNNIVFFDGNCGFCDTSIRQIMRIDVHARIRYAPLQGETAARLLPPELREHASLSTLVYLDAQSRRFTKSEAFFELFRAIGGVWKLALILRIVPLRWRDSAYDAIAKRRRSLFSKESCPLPTEDQKARILP